MSEAIKRLAAAIAEQDHFTVMPDDTPVMLEPLGENCVYELVVVSELGRRLTLADLRAIVSEAGL